jgi:predicted RNA methylase
MALETWHQLFSPAHDELRAKAASIDPASGASVAAITQLRAQHDAALVHAALQLAAARRKAVFKWPSERAVQIIADPIGVEMASSWIAATHKAARFARACPGQRVLDLCCGIGGDAMGLRDAGCDVLGVDLDPVRAWMCAVNATCETRALDVADASLPPGPFHLDPARRATSPPPGTGARRARTLDELAPGPDLIRTLLAGRRDGAIKLAPGVDESDLREHGLIPADRPYELEYISERGRMTQAVLWLGELASTDVVRRATMLPVGRSIAGQPDAPGREPPTVDALGAFLYEVDDSVERAGLLSVLCAEHQAPMLHPKLGLLTTDRDLQDPLLTKFQALSMMPWKQPRIEAELKRIGAGHVEVKTRGAVVNPDQLQPALSKKTGTPHTLFVLRFGRDVRAIIARRCS